MASALTDSEASWVVQSYVQEPDGSLDEPQISCHKLSITVG
jgi:hypothetical protein